MTAAANNNTQTSNNNNNNNDSAPPQGAKPNSFSKEFVRSCSEFFKRDLISVPLIKSHSHHSISKRCEGLRASTLELDTSAHPNIDYIAGNRLSVYPANPPDQVQFVIKHLIDDISTMANSNAAPSGAASPAKSNSNGNNPYKKLKLATTTITAPTTTTSSDPLAQFVRANKTNSLQLALTYLYDITTAPSRDLLRVLADCCASKEQKSKLIQISKSNENWEKWLCSNLKTLKSTFEEFNSIQKISAKRLLSELALQQPRLYSLASIKSHNRFRTEIIVVQHRFSKKQIAISLQNLKEREKIQLKEQQEEEAEQRVKNFNLLKPSSPNSTSSTINNNPTSVRSLRSMATFAQDKPSPISSQLIKKVPSYSGPLMSMYAMSSSLNEASKSSKSGSGKLSATSTTTEALKSATTAAQQHHHHSHSSSSANKVYEGSCSTYLLNLQANDCILCEFVENPRFTLKGNRERPIMMIGQDVGLIAFKPFWQQRAYEHDRAQIFYTLFKDLKRKKFGDMHLVCLIGSKCKIEDLLKHEIQAILTHKIISSCQYVHRDHLNSLLDKAAASNAQPQANNMDNIIHGKELVELGMKMAKLLIDCNGCLYICCDPHMTQAIEILLVESLVKYSPSLTRDKVMTLLLPKWKGRKPDKLNSNLQQTDANKYLYTLENAFERAQIVEEIYDTTI